jgi:hypothetical protein
MYEVAALVAANVAVVLQPLTSMAAGGQLFRRRFFFGHGFRGDVVGAEWLGMHCERVPPLATLRGDGWGPGGGCPVQLSSWPSHW